MYSTSMCLTQTRQVNSYNNKNDFSFTQLQFLNFKFVSVISVGNSAPNRFRGLAQPRLIAPEYPRSALSEINRLKPGVNVTSNSHNFPNTNFRELWYIVHEHSTLDCSKNNPRPLISHPSGISSLSPRILLLHWQIGHCMTNRNAWGSTLIHISSPCLTCQRL